MSTFNDCILFPTFHSILFRHTLLIYFYIIYCRTKKLVFITLFAYFTFQIFSQCNFPPQVTHKLQNLTQNIFPNSYKFLKYQIFISLIKIYYISIGRPRGRGRANTSQTRAKTASKTFDHVESLIKSVASNNSILHKADLAMRWVEFRNNEVIQKQMLKALWQKERFYYEQLKDLRARNGVAEPSFAPKKPKVLDSALRSDF